LVWLGRWSYSLYLVHPIALIVMRRYSPHLFETRLGWVFGFGAVLLFSYLFYLAVEKPSHALARRVRLFATGRVDALTVAEPTPKQA
jgi:peptidoglycan/LPS O-acetylase OafA/YrhL